MWCVVVCVECDVVIVVVLCICVYCDFVGDEIVELDVYFGWYVEMV